MKNNEDSHKKECYDRFHCSFAQKKNVFGEKTFI